MSTVEYTTLAPNRMYGWDPALTVEIAKVENPLPSRTSYKVQVDGEVVGYAVSRREGRHNVMWDYVRTEAQITDLHIVFSFPKRDLAITALVEASA
jgi:hypothetical protein